MAEMKLLLLLLLPVRLDYHRSESESAPPPPPPPLGTVMAEQLCVGIIIRDWVFLRFQIGDNGLERGKDLDSNTSLTSILYKYQVKTNLFLFSFFPQGFVQYGITVLLLFSSSSLVAQSSAYTCTLYYFPAVFCFLRFYCTHTNPEVVRTSPRPIHRLWTPTSDSDLAPQHSRTAAGQINARR